MEKKQIKEYIQFAINNGYILYGYKNKITEKIYSISKFKIYITINNLFNLNFIELITSKDFIDSIAKGITKKTMLKEKYNFGILGDWIFYNKNHYNDFKKELINCQAEAIYNGTLDLFINKILGLK